MKSIKVPPEIVFDEGQPFFDYVSAYITAICGLESLANPSNLMNFSPGEVVVLSGNIQPEIRIEQLSIFQQVKNGKISIQHTVNSLGCMLINTAYESVSHLNDHSREFEFFRHIRHAASHGNRFNFKAKEPLRPAAWRGNLIDEKIRGSQNPLHGIKCIGNIMSGADVILLLWDIENQLKHVQ